MRAVQLSEESLAEAAGAILRGEAVVYPTETLYGIAANASDAAAVERVFEIKRRPPDKPSPVIAADMEMVRLMVERVPDAAMRLIEAFWPGPLTIIFDARKSVPDILTAGSGSVGIRISCGEAAKRLVRKTGRPITATSANISGRGDPSDPQTIKKDLADNVRIIIDVGKMKPGPGSTVVDPRGDSPIILREGAVPAEAIFEAWKGRLTK